MHKLTIRAKTWHNKYKIFNFLEIDNFCLKDLFVESNCTELQTYKVKERTFGTRTFVYSFLSLSWIN